MTDLADASFSASNRGVRRQIDLTSKRDELLQLAKNDALTPIQLNMIIDQANKYGFSDAELDILVKSHARALSTAQEQPRLCPSCHMISSNCTCKRSWF